MEFHQIKEWANNPMVCISGLVKKNIDTLIAAVESLTALCEKQQKIVDAQAYDLKDRNATIDRYVESAARDRAQVASLTAEKEAARQTITELKKELERYESEEYDRQIGGE